MGADKSAETTQMPQNLSAKIVCPGPKVLDFDEKRLHWASVVGDCKCGIIPEENGLYPGSNRAGDLFMIFCEKLKPRTFISGVLLYCLKFIIRTVFIALHNFCLRKF